MARTPTQLVSDYLSRDPALLRDAGQRLTLADHPADLRDRIADIVRPSARHGYAVRHNERMIRTHTDLGALRRALVQWATQHAPREIAGYRPLLLWALARVDWSAVIACLAASPHAMAIAPPLVHRSERSPAWRRVARWEPTPSMR